jgi:hypothetical protein
MIQLPWGSNRYEGLLLRTSHGDRNLFSFSDFFRKSMKSPNRTDGLIRMVMLIVFGLLFLIGFAFLIALLGTTFLKKHSVRLPDRYRTGIVERPSSNYQQKPQFPARDYREKPGDLSAQDAGRRDINMPMRAPSMSHEMYPSRGAGTAGGGKWAFVAPIVVVAVVLVLLFGMREFVGSDVRPRLHFCESVDFARLKPIHRSDTFTRGNVTIFVKSKAPLLLENARVEIYRLNAAGFEPYTEKELILKPEWASFSIRTLFDTVGSYMVSVYGNDDVLLNQKNINIVPDTLAYRPVR